MKEKLSSVEAAKKRLEELANKNLDWFGKDGWVHYVRTPLPGGIDKFRYYSQERWLFLEDGQVKKDLLIVVDPITEAEIQRYVMDETGIRVELVELRASGMNARQFAVPIETQWTVTNVSDIWMDLGILNALEKFITSIELVELKHAGTDCVMMTVEYQGDPEIRQLGLPPSEGKIGKREQFIYEIASGVRVQYSRGFINENGQVDEPNTFTEKTELIATISDEVGKEWDMSKKELIFYKTLFE